jgi:hypothetical protein
MTARPLSGSDAVVNGPLASVTLIVLLTLLYRLWPDPDTKDGA